MPKAVITFVFKVLRNGLLRYILYTCPKLWSRLCSKWYGMDCFGTYFTHAQSCGNVHVQCATEWTASVHTLHMPNVVITFVFKVLRNGLLPCSLCTCPKLWSRSCSKCYGMDCFGTCFTHCTKLFEVLQNGLFCYTLFTQSRENVRVESATKWTASVHTSHMPKAVITSVFKMLLGALLNFRVFPFSRFRVFAFSRFRVFLFSQVESSRFRVFAFSCSAGGTPVAGTQSSCAQYLSPPHPLRSIRGTLTSPTPLHPIHCVASTSGKENCKLWKMDTTTPTESHPYPWISIYALTHVRIDVHTFRRMHTHIRTYTYVGTTYVHSHTRTHAQTWIHDMP